MPLTQLDATAALIVIDLQKGVIAMPTVHPISDIVSRSAQLARAFRRRGLPVVLVNVTATAPGRTDVGKSHITITPDFAELTPELGRHADDLIVSKQRVGALIGPSLNDLLRSHSITQILLNGVPNSSKVKQTARSAYDHGYNVVLVVDAMTDRNPEAHRHSVEITFPKLGETDTTDNVLKLLQAEPD
jgi:nicotinamidase-related amidase